MRLATIGAVSSAALAALVASLCFTQAANAQTVLNGPPPIYSFVDANGVDLTTGSVITAHTDVSIGQGVGAMAYSRTFFGSGWRDNATATISVSGSTYTVSVGATSESFTLSGTATYTSVQKIGSMLSYNSTTQIYTYTQRNGTVFIFNAGLITASPQLSTVALLTSITNPNGLVTTYTWKTANLCASGGGSCNTYGRLQSINNNAGYQLKLSYSLNGPTNTSQVTAWQLLTVVTAINNAVQYCDPTQDSCSGLSGSWPTATYNAVSSTQQTVTDSLGRVWTYTWNSAGLATIQPPMTTTAARSYTYNLQHQVLTYSNGSATWTYAYSTSGSTLTTTANDPSSHTRVVLTDTTTGLVSSDTDGLGNTTSYGYDTGTGRLTSYTLPEGNSVQYTLDGRGNATQTAYNPKSGSGLAAVTTTASYTGVCTYPASCNEPTRTTDGNLNKTYYTYDNTHGFLLTVSPPDPVLGATAPQIRFTYTGQYANYNLTGAGIVNGPGLIYQLTGTSQCQTQAAAVCPGTADEVTTALVYGSTVSSVANNLGLTTSTTAAGDGSLSATTTITYDQFGNVETTQGPISVAYRTRYRYDADREVTGVISPNPGASEGLAYPAVRYTYNADGLITLAEQGTVASQLDSDWAAFATITQTAAGYDNLDRATYTIAANSSGTERSVLQYTYDSANHLECVALRMNSTLFGTLPSSPLGTLPSSACSRSTAGSYGRDRITQIAYDGDNRPNQIISGYEGVAQATTLTKTFTNNGLASTLLDAMSNLTTYTYDGFDRLSQINYPSATQSAGTSSSTDYEAYTYDANSNVLSDRRRDGTSLNYCYDALNRQIRKDFPGSTSTNCTLTSLSGSVFNGYDLLNRLTYAYYNSTTSGTGVAYTYDALSRALTEAQTAGTMSYQYDLAGDLTQITWPDAFYVGYAYDVLGRIRTVNANGATSGLGVLGSYSYNNLGQETGLVFGNGASATYTYDSLNRLYTLAQAFPGSTSSNVTFTYGYNPADQIATKSADNSSYVYHPANTTTTYVSTGVNRYSSVNGTTYHYDARQNLTSDGTRAFTYDSENNLLTGSAPTAISFTYDTLDRTLNATTGGTTVTNIYSGQMDTGLYAGSTVFYRRIPVPGQNGWLMYYYGAGSTAPFFAATDELGSIINSSDSTGSASSANGYGPFGEPAAWSGLNNYTGQLQIAQALLYNYKARMYDPGLGRFLQTDPIGYASDINAYAYVWNDPINLIDPSGMDGTIVPTSCPNINCPEVVTGACPTGEVGVHPGGDQSQPIVCESVTFGGGLGFGNGGGGGGVGGGGGGGGGGAGSQNNANNQPFACKESTSPLAKLADAADAVSAAADVTAVGAAGAALVTSETVVGGITFTGIAVGADLTSEGAGVVSVLANVGAGRFGNAALGAFGVALGLGSGPLKAAPAITRYLNRVGLTGVSHAFASICP